MSLRALAVRIGERRVGHLERDVHGRAVFRYDDGWRDSGKFPLSISLPLAATQHRSKVVEPYLWGLLPDNEVILDAWAARFQTSARNAMGLLAHVGADCAGAVQFLTEESLAHPQADAIDWLSEAEIATRLARLREDSSAWRDDDDAGQFSLGGAQAKIALIGMKGRWGIPSGRLPTTHIFKPGMRELRGHAENEHFCLSLLRELGLPAAASSVEHFAGETAIVVERYDRVRVGEDIVRVHQEDLCQATATMPAVKYQNEGGPSAQTIAGLLRDYSADPKADLATFVDAIVISWALVATDAHAKNYSVLHVPGRIRLAPLYDVASVLPYVDPALRRVKLAMSVGGKYRVNEIAMRHWARFASDCGLSEEAIRASLARILAALPDAAESVRKRLAREGVKHPIVKKLADAIIARAGQLVSAA